MPVPSSNVSWAVERILELEPGLDYLLYMGVLPFSSRLMTRVPDRFEKQSWVLVGRILRKDLVDERVYELLNWNINLSNGDIV